MLGCDTRAVAAAARRRVAHQSRRRREHLRAHHAAVAAAPRGLRVPRRPREGLGADADQHVGEGEAPGRVRLHRLGARPPACGRAAVRGDQPRRHDGRHRRDQPVDTRHAWRSPGAASRCGR
jgi:hypothetical protein